MEFEPTRLPEVILIKPSVFGDARGLFFETCHEYEFAESGIDARLVQDSQGQSTRHALRGLRYHFKQPQGKRVRVASGEVFDVAVDLRRQSPRYGRWVGVVLSDTNHHLLWVPPGLAQGYLTLSPEVDFLYKCTDFYARGHQRAVHWDDPHLGVQWPLPDGAAPLRSRKQRTAPQVADEESYA